jgi:Lipocalin-like domain
MTRRGLLATTAALAGARALAGSSPPPPGAHRSGLRARLLGAWHLTDAVTVYASGGTGPWYDRPGPYQGLIVYDASGAMSVQIASARAPARSPPEFAAMATAERLAYLQSYYAYFGRFEVDEARSEVRHWVATSLDPTESGVTYTQRMRLAHGRLTLTTQPWRVGDQWRHSRLRWIRA